MADNTTLDAGAGGDAIVTREISHAGDTAKLPGSFLMGISGTEGSYTAAAIGGDAANGIDVDVTRVSGTVTVDGSGVTQPVSHAALTELAAAINGSSQMDVNIAASSATLTVASHAVTNAGTFGVQVDGSALTALQLIDDVVYVDDADWTDSTSKHMLIGGLYQSTPQTITDGDVGPLQTDANGNLKVAIISGAGSGGTASADDADFTAGTTSGTPAMGAYESTPTSVTDGDVGFVGITQTRAMRCSVENTVTVGSHNVTNAGTFVVQVDGSALTSLQLIDDVIVADDAAFTPGTTKVAMVGFQADETATDSVNEGDGGAARMTLDRKIITTPQPHTAGGLSIARDIDLDNGALTVVKAAAGQLYGWHITNNHTAIVYVKFYDATSGTLGTGTPVLTVGIPGNSTDSTLAMASFGGMGVEFTTGICAGAGTGVADADNTDPGANKVVANFYYK